MKKVLVLLLAFSLFSVAVMAQSLTERQLNKINAKEAFRFPQPCDIEQKVIDTAKKVYEKNRQDFASVYNYAVVLSVGECDDGGVWIFQSAQAKLLFSEALKLKLTSPSCFAGLAYLTMYESGLAAALYDSSIGRDNSIFTNAVKKEQARAKEAVQYMDKALKYKYVGDYLKQCRKNRHLLNKSWINWNRLISKPKCVKAFLKNSVNSFSVNPRLEKSAGIFVVSGKPPA